MTDAFLEELLSRMLFVSSSSLPSDIAGSIRAPREYFYRALLDASGMYRTDIVLVDPLEMFRMYVPADARLIDLSKVKSELTGRDVVSYFLLNY